MCKISLLRVTNEVRSMYNFVEFVSDSENLYILSNLLDLLMMNLGMSLINLMNNLGGFYG